MSRAVPGCEPEVVNGAEGLLTILGVVAAGSALVLLIVRLTDGW